MSNSKKRLLIIGYSKKTHVITAHKKDEYHLTLFETEKKIEEYKGEYEEFYDEVVIFKDLYQWSELENVLKQMDPPDAVVTRFDHYVNVAGAINDYFGLSGLKYSETKAFSNKYLMKKRFLANGVPCAEGICIDNLDNPDELNAFLKTHPFPNIVKTTTGTHSSFVVKVNSIPELMSARDTILTHTKDGWSSKSVQGFTEEKQECRVLLEEMLSGREISIDTFISDGSFLHTPICEYVMPDSLDVDDSYLPIRTMPADISPDMRSIILTTTQEALRALGAKNCVCHTELFIDEEKNSAHLIESTPRGGGNRAEMTLKTTGFDYDFQYLRAAMGEDLPSISEPNSAVSVVEYFAPKEGVIESMDLSFLDEHPSVSEVRIRNKEGDQVKQARDGGKNIVLFFVESSSYDELLELAINLFNQVRDSVKIK